MIRQIMLTVEAYALLIRWDLFMRSHTLADLCGSIRSLPMTSKRLESCSADVVYDALEIACALYTKQVLCLQRSSVLTRMLRSRGLAAQLTIGSQRAPFRAHAWVTLDGHIFRDKLARREFFLIVEVC